MADISFMQRGFLFAYMQLLNKVVHKPTNAAMILCMIPFPNIRAAVLLVVIQVLVSSLNNLKNPSQIA